MLFNVFDMFNIRDELDAQMADMTLRILRGDTIPLDEWDDLKDEVIEDINEKIDQWNESPEGMTLEEAEEMADADRKAFLSALKQFGLSLEDRFQLCSDLYELAEKQSSPELLQVFCDIASGNDYLLDIELNRQSREEYIECWTEWKEDSVDLYDYLSERSKLVERYKANLAEAKSLHSVQTADTSESSDELEQIFQMYIELYEVQDNQDSRARLMDNIAHLLQLANSSKVLATWKPLFLYQAMTQHKKRLLKSADLHIDIGALWEYQQYKIEEDNGKNYKAYRKQLELFSHLCDITGKGETVDLPLCTYGFERLSNLAEFYWMDDESTCIIPFETTVEDTMDYSSHFSYFPDKEQGNILLQESGYSYEKLGRLFRKIGRREEEDKHHALMRIDTYLNENVDELCDRFLEINQDLEQVKKLCGDILTASKLSEKQRPKTAEETEVFLIAINDALMNIIDEYIREYLISAGKALVGEICE